MTDSSGAQVPGFVASRTGVGTYAATLPANLETLDTYDVLWSWPNGQSRRSQFEVVGGFVFGVQELRDFASELGSVPVDKIVEVRAVVEERFETWCGVAFVPRGHRAYLSGQAARMLRLPHVETRKLVSVRVDGIAWSGAELATVVLHASGILERTTGVWPLGVWNIEVLYEHGYPSTPAPVRRAALRYARYLLSSSAYDDRATAVFTEAGGFRLTIAGRDGPTGLPEVDAVLSSYRVAGFA